MEIIKFKECNCTYAKDQPEYLPLPAHKTNDGIVTSCWKLSWLDKLIILFSGRVWLRLMTFNNPVQPQLMSVKNPFKNWSEIYYD